MTTECKDCAGVSLALFPDSTQSVCADVTLRAPDSTVGFTAVISTQKLYEI